MENFGIDKEKTRQLRTGAQHASHILNNVIGPILRDLAFLIDTSDTDKLDRYMRDLSALRADYIHNMIEGTDNPALAAVLEKTAKELWEKAVAAHPLRNPGIVGEIPTHIFDFLTITGNNIATFRASINSRAIEKACTIEATPEDIAKREEIAAVCKSLNACFNGLGTAFGQFIFLAPDGKFYPIESAKNYKPLIYGTQQ